MMLTYEKRIDRTTRNREEAKLRTAKKKQVWSELEREKELDIPAAAGAGGQGSFTTTGTGTAEAHR